MSVQPSAARSTQQRGLIRPIWLMLILGTLACYWQVREFDFVNCDELNPGYEPAHYSLGVCYALKGKMNDAIAELKTAVRLAPADTNAQKKLDAVLESVTIYRQ